MSYYFNDQHDTTSISNSNVIQIFEDSKSNLWIATDKGLNIFNRETNTFNQIMASDLT